VYVDAKIVDNFSHESYATSLPDAFTSRLKKAPFLFFVDCKYEETLLFHYNADIRNFLDSLVSTLAVYATTSRTADPLKSSGKDFLVRRCGRTSRRRKRKRREGGRHCQWVSSKLFEGGNKSIHKNLFFVHWCYFRISSCRRKRKRGEGV